MTEETISTDTPYVVFETPSLLDLRSLTLMGVSAKPNATNPIGCFGTGLKYAVAALTRLDASLDIYIGGNHFKVTKEFEDFRGTKVVALRLEQHFAKGGRPWFRSGTSVDLPFTMNYGRNWTAESVFRELESNTRDEGGVTYQLREDPGPCFNAATRVVVKHPDFHKAYVERDSVFLPEAVRAGSGIQSIYKESTHLYRRGVKVFTLPEPLKTLFTYNFLSDLSITEDRTLASEYEAKLALGMWLQRSEDEWTLEKILTAGKGYWEHGVIFIDILAPSATFHKVAMKHPKNLPPSFSDYYSKHDERVTVQTFDLSAAHPGPWRMSGGRVVDKHGKTIFEAPYDYGGNWKVTGAALLKKLGQEPPVEEAASEDDLPF